MAAGIRVGKADVDVKDMGHVEGIKQGNSRGNYDKQVGHRPDGRSSAARSTGINPGKREPIDPRMPNLSPG
jgi:hypothetical protein